MSGFHCARAPDLSGLVIFCSGSVGFSIGIISGLLTKSPYSNYIISFLLGLTIATYAARVGYSSSKNIETIPMLEGLFGGILGGYYLSSAYLK